jgi:hypothetical protein
MWTETEIRRQRQAAKAQTIAELERRRKNAQWYADQEVGEYRAHWLAVAANYTDEIATLDPDRLSERN